MANPVPAPGVAVAVKFELSLTKEFVSFATAVCAPSVVPSVQVAVTRPAAFEVPEGGTMAPPPVRAANVTLAPCTGRPPASLTFSRRNWEGVDPIGPTCELPEPSCIDEAKAELLGSDGPVDASRQPPIRATTVRIVATGLAEKSLRPCIRTPC